MSNPAQDRTIDLMEMALEAVDEHRYERATALAAIAQAAALSEILNELQNIRLEIAAGNPI